MVKSEPKIYSSPEPSTKCLPSTSSSESSSATNNNKKKKYKGVRMRSWGSWVSEIRAPNQKARIWLGSYSTAEAAARAYDAALLCIKGPTAANPSLNFPISTSHFQHMDNNVAPMSPKSIQRIAAAAAAVTSTGAPQPPAPQQALSPSSVVSSPSMSCSSPSEDDGSHPPSHFVHESIAEIDSWCNFESPKYVDLMMVNNVASFDCVPPTLDDFLYEEGDIRLWNFC